MNTQTKPKSKINGVHNPEYRRWWRREHPAQSLALIRRASEKWKAKVHETNERCSRDETKCIGCGRVYSKENVLLEPGFKILRGMIGTRCICPDCRDLS